MQIEDKKALFNLFFIPTPKIAICNCQTKIVIYGVCFLEISSFFRKKSSSCYMFAMQSEGGEKNYFYK